MLGTLCHAIASSVPNAETVECRPTDPATGVACKLSAESAGTSGRQPNGRAGVTER